MNHQSKTINSGPIGASKASTLDKYFNDLYSHDKRIFQTLPDDILDTMQCCTGNVTCIGYKLILTDFEIGRSFQKVQYQMTIHFDMQ